MTRRTLLGLDGDRHGCGLLGHRCIGRVDAAPDRRVPLRRLWDLNARLGTGNFGWGARMLNARRPAKGICADGGMAGAVQAGQRAAGPMNLPPTNRMVPSNPALAAYLPAIADGVAYG